MGPSDGVIGSRHSQCAASGTVARLPDEGLTLTDDSSGLEHEMLVFSRLYPRLHQESGTTASGPAAALARAEYALLRLLDTAGPLRLGEVARALELDPSTVTRHAQLLGAKGLVRGAADGDRRTTRLHLTGRGQRAVRGVHAGRVDVVTALMREWSPDDRRAFLALLERFNAEGPPGRAS